MLDNKKLTLSLFLLLNLCVAISVRPGSGPVSVTPYYFASGNNYCLTFTDRAPVEIIIDLPPLEPSKNIVSFRVKQDTGSDIEIATPGNEKGYESISAFLPEQKPKEYWQKVEYKIDQPIRTLYLKLIPNKRYSRNIIYLSQPIWLIAEQTKSIDIFKVSANITIKYDYAREQTIYIPILPDSENLPSKFNAEKYQALHLTLSSTSDLPLGFSLDYTKNSALAEQALPWTEQIIKITPRQKGWQNIVIPLNSDLKNGLLGLKITLPIDSAGTFYLDNLYLQ